MISTSALSWWHVSVFFLVVMFFAYLAEKFNLKILVIIIGIILICVNGLRHGYVDTRAYRLGFESVDVSQVFNWNSFFDKSSKGTGFKLINILIRKFTDDGQVFLFIMGAITVGCLFFCLVKRAPEITFATFLFVCTGCYLDTMNGVRQALASALLFALLPKLIIDKKFVKYLIVVLLVSTIHSTALVFIPLYFVVLSEPWSKSTAVLSLVSVVAFLLLSLGFGGVILDLLEGTTYANDYGEMLLSANTSVNVTRVFVAAVPLVLSYFYRNDENKNFPLYNISFNMSLINFFVWLFATRVLYFYRLAMYFQPYMILLLCYEMYYISKMRDRQIYRIVAVVLFIIWHWFSLRAMGISFFVGYLKY